MNRPGTPARVRRLLAVLLAMSALVLAGCSSSGNGAPQAVQKATPTKPAPPPKSSATIVTSLDKVHGPVTVDRALTVTAEHGRFQQVVVRTGGTPVPGTLSRHDTVWSAGVRLEPGLRYQIRAVAVDSKGLKATRTSSFRTEYLPLDRQTYPSIAPLPGETVGVGMPVIVHFDVPVTDRARIQRHLSVVSTPHQVGAWHWISSQEVHWRPRTYWQPGTKVTVNADINSVPAGNGVYGQVNNSTTFYVGRSIICRVNVATHQMKVYVNGALVRTVAISAGKPGFITRSGTKVIIEKRRHMIMDAKSIGIPKNSPNYYRLPVDFAMRVTYSGEFLHAAPWSASEQGVANVSHGCVGMTTANARWLFDLTHGRGDVVEVTGSSRHMTLDNGYGDWNESFAEYAKGSAL